MYMYVICRTYMCTMYMCICVFLERDTEVEACQRFFRDGLSLSFNRILTDDAVSTWKPDIQVFLHSLQTHQTCILQYMYMCTLSEHYRRIFLYLGRFRCLHWESTVNVLAVYTAMIVKVYMYLLHTCTIHTSY